MSRGSDLMRVPARGKALALVGVTVLSASCAPIFPRALLEQVDRSVSFQRLAGNPDDYRGRLVVFGGEVVRTTRGPGWTEIEVLQRPLDSGRVPRLDERSRGRFLVKVPDALGRDLPELGDLITVVGGVEGSEERSGDSLPALEVQDLKSWPSSKAFIRYAPGSGWPYWRDPFWWHGAHHAHHHGHP